MLPKTDENIIESENKKECNKIENENSYSSKPYELRPRKLQNDD